MADVSVTDVGECSAELRGSVDEGYRSKYLRDGFEQMISDSAAATTLLLEPLE